MVLDLAIDLGTNSIKTYLHTKGLVFDEPSCVTIDKTTHKVLKVGKEASLMLGRTPGNIIAVSAVTEGVISQYNATVKLLSNHIKKAQNTGLIKPRVLLCVPSCITEVGERALCDAAYAAGARKVYLIEEILASAMGAGIETDKPGGNLVMNIGAGTCEIGVISSGGIIANTSIKVAGNALNAAITRYIRKKYNILIGEKTAEEIKIKIGSVLPFGETYSAEFKGRHIVDGLPKVVSINSDEIYNVLSAEIKPVCDHLCDILERTPPDLLADISRNGIILTGGSCMLFGFDKLIERASGIRTLIAENPLSCAAFGAGHCLDLLGVMQDGIINVQRQMLERL